VALAAWAIVFAAMLVHIGKTLFGPLPTAERPRQ
jgi:hypothetical protein